MATVKGRFCTSYSSGPKERADNFYTVQISIFVSKCYLFNHYISIPCPNQISIETVYSRSHTLHFLVEIFQVSLSYLLLLTHGDLRVIYQDQNCLMFVILIF